MNRQRLLIIFGAAWVSAALLTWLLWSRSQGPKQEKSTRVVVAARFLPGGKQLTAADLKVVALPAGSVPGGAFADPKQAVGRVLIYPISENEPLTPIKLAALGSTSGLPATIPQGMRAISVAITDASGVAGLLAPRSRVDILFTRAGNLSEALTTTVLEDIEVFSIGRTTDITPATQTAPGTAPVAQANVNVLQTRAVTLLVTPEEAQKLELARNEGRLSLSLRNPLDKSRIASRAAITAEVIDPYLFTRVRRPIPTGLGGGASAWDQIPGHPTAKQKAEPKPTRVTIDVFRGDKHLQETFQ